MNNITEANINRSRANIQDAIKLLALRNKPQRVKEPLEIKVQKTMPKQPKRKARKAIVQPVKPAIQKPKKAPKARKPKEQPTFLSSDFIVPQIQGFNCPKI